jgi:sugar phosphate isomerase/epimerase
MFPEKLSFTVFTKPWRDLSIEQIAKKVASLGLAGVELPVRPGFQVEPDNAAQDLPEAQKIFADHGLKIFSIGGSTDSSLIEACAKSQIPLVRVMPQIPESESYMDAEARFIREYTDAVPALKDTGVRLGLQSHEGRFVSSASGLRRILDHFDPAHVGAVYDPAHCSLAGEIVPFALEILWPYLAMVNLKNAIYRRVSGPEAREVKWNRYWTAGNMGLTSWSEVADELAKRNFAGNVLLFNEYADQTSVDRLLADDVAFSQEVFNKAYST